MPNKTARECLDEINKCIDTGDINACRAACHDLIDACCDAPAPKAAANGQTDQGEDQAVCDEIRSKCSNPNLKPKGGISPSQLGLIVTLVQFAVDFYQKWRSGA